MSNEVVGQTLAPQTEAPSITITTAPEPTDDAVVIIRTTVLVFLLVLSLIGNALVVLSVAQARSSRYIPFNSFVLSMASYCLLECAFTMSLATGFSIEKQWNFGNFMAGFNAAFVQLQNIGVFLTIAVMAIDRYVAVTKFTKYHSPASKHKANYVALYTWIHSLLFSLPLFFQNQTIGITCRAFVERCLCGLVEGTSAVFTIYIISIEKASWIRLSWFLSLPYLFTSLRSLLVAFCFAIPFIIIFVFMIGVRQKAAKERERIKSDDDTDYASYRLQESIILKEAVWCKYVIILFVLFLIFKLPYIVVDIMTQLNFPLVFEPEASGDGARFYFQIALSWMTFCYSALFPIVTFFQFPDHWRKMKSYVTCAPTTTSAANGGPLTRSQRQRQRRLRQRERITIRNARSKKRASLTNTSTTQTKDKAPSTISTSITSEKIAVPAAGQVLFRVPVLYAATDGLHIVASSNMLTTKVKEKKTKASTSSSNKGEAINLPSTSTNQISQPSSDVIGELRPSSVVDKRVDVTGSRDHLDDDIAYINSAHFNSDFDPDETDSELNESVNSRTHIWPHARPRVAACASSVKVKDWRTKSVWDDDVAITRWSYEELERSSIHNAVPLTEIADIRGEVDPPHPHTPSPPPDEEAFSASPLGLNNTMDEAPIDEHLVEKVKFSKLRLPSISGRNIPIAFAKPIESRQEPLISQSAKTRDHGESTDQSGGSAVAATIKQNVALAANRVFPNQPKAFLNEDVIIQDVDSSRDADKIERFSELDHNVRHDKSKHKVVKVASRKKTRHVAQHIGHYKRPSLLPDIISETR